MLSGDEQPEDVVAPRTFVGGVDLDRCQFAPFQIVARTIAAPDLSAFVVDGDRNHASPDLLLPKIVA
jgi:hypothetical protein